MKSDNPFKVDLTKAPKEKIFYSLAMFPYPSGVGLHVGHAMNFTANDIIARYKRMSGFSVLNPIGWDSFGLPTEGYAMKVGRPTSEVTKENIANFIAQCKLMDRSYDRDREFATSDPEYYKRTQRIFQQLYKAGLVYRKEAFVNRCPHDQTVLANDQVVDGKCERCGTEVVQKKHMQRFIKITDYAEKLIADLDGLDWPEETKIQQKYRIGKSEGAEIDFTIAVDHNAPIVVGTPHPEEEKRNTISAVVQRKSDGKFLLVKWKKHNRISPSIGGIDEGETPEQAAEREVLEETGYKVKAIKKLGGIIESHFFAENKNIRRGRYDQPVLLELIDENPRAVTEEEKEIQEPVRLSYEEALEQVTHKDNLIGFQRYMNDQPKITVFTTRPDTIYGVTAIVLAPENESLDAFIIPENKAKLEEYRKTTGKKTNLERQQDTEERSGIFSGVYAIHPLTGEQVPVRFADYVLMDYATGAVMFVPAHDERDFAFAKKNNLPTKQVIQNDAFEEGIANTGTGILINSDQFNGITNEEAKKKVTDYLEANGLGRRKTTYKLRDRSVSRQRYWGSPIPVYYDENGNPQLIPEDELPVLLPLDVKDYKPQGKSPLADHPTFPHYKAKDGKTYLRECDTLDTFMCSSFYFIRFIDPKNDKELVSKELADKTLPVDFYIGGKEHTYGHLLYARFINKFLYDQGYLTNKEPFQKLFHQGMLLGPDGRKMSKRRGNVITPEDLSEKFGAEKGIDILRTYSMFMGPLEIEKVRNDNAVDGVKRFLERVERMSEFIKTEKSHAWVETDNNPNHELMHDKKIDAKLNQTIKAVSEDIEKMKFNTAVSKLMVFVNYVYNSRLITKQQLSTFLQILAPFATKLTQQMREALGGDGNIHLSTRPTFDPSKIAEELINLPVQINGKTRGAIDVNAGVSQDEVIEMVKSDEKLHGNIVDKEIVKIIFVQDKIINIIVK